MFRLFFVSLLAFFANDLLACPSINNLRDFNCDGKIRIAITGDSIVYGIRDTKRMGYAGRIYQYLPGVKVNKIGFPGISASRLLRAYKRDLSVSKLSSSSEIFNASRNIDLYIVDVGRNDFWIRPRRTPSIVARDIARLVKLIRNNLRSIEGRSPLTVATLLLPTTRPNQQLFIDAVNKEMLKLNSTSFQVAIRLSSLGVENISEDGIHPNTMGYRVIASKVSSYISRLLMKS
jgi:lysophospholipase L1-like esterase